MVTHWGWKVSVCFDLDSLRLKAAGLAVGFCLVHFSSVEPHYQVIKLLLPGKKHTKAPNDLSKNDRVEKKIGSSLYES